MAKWNTHTDDVGTAEETEVHEIQLTVLTLEVSKAKVDSLWTIAVFAANSEDAIGDIEHDSDLIRAKVRAITKTIAMLEKDGATLYTAMLETTDLATKRRDELASQR